MIDFSNKFHVIGMLVFVAFVLLQISIVSLTLIKRSKFRNRNKKLPVVSSKATMISKRIQNVILNGHGSTVYFCTFELEDGNRIELLIDGREYGLLAEGDCGEVTYQGDRFISIDRK